uniref:Mitochondrial 2-oxoglutarate/malate carrier protein n=1 Tax=Scleropages formosus TaxID=113540 RepID=A0A8C9S9K0_SCLFO
GSEFSKSVKSCRSRSMDKRGLDFGLTSSSLISPHVLCYSSLLCSSFCLVAHDSTSLFALLFYSLSAGLLRQATYTTTRLGIYTVLFERLSKADGTPPNFFIKALIGMTAGAIGAFVGTPAEVALIRMTADGRLPSDQRRGYTNVFNALIRITREEGVTTLWRGCIPTMARAVVVNAAQLASYSQSKQALLDTGYFRDDILCHFCASMISGLVTTAASMPVDIVKTRIQNMKMIDGKPEYKNGLDVLVKVVGREGFFSLWKGFTPYYARLGPHTVLTFIFLEQMNKFYKIYFLDS